MQENIKIVPDGSIEPEPYVNCRAVLPVSEEVLKTTTMARQLTVPKTIRPLFNGNKTSNQLIVMFSVVLSFKINAVRRRQEKVIVLRPIHELVLLFLLEQRACNQTYTFSSLEGGVANPADQSQSICCIKFKNEF